MNYTIDWLSCSHYQLRDEFDLRTLAIELSGDNQCKRTKPRNGYKFAVVDKNGIIYQSGGMPSMGTNVTATGAAISSLTQDAERLDYLVSEVLSTWHISRLDLALDFRTDIIGAVRAAIDRKGYDTPARNVSILTSGEDGYTAYFGSRSSNKFLRIYNKQAESNTAEPWVRFELELKNESAEQCGRAIYAHGLVPTMRTFFSEYLKISLPEYNAFIDGAMIEYAPSQVKLRNTRDWMMGQVAKAMVRTMKEGDEYLFGDFCRRIAELLEKDDL